MSMSKITNLEEEYALAQLYNWIQLNEESCPWKLYPTNENCIWATTIADIHNLSKIPFICVDKDFFCSTMEETPLLTNEDVIFIKSVTSIIKSKYENRKNKILLSAEIYSGDSSSIYITMYI